jgi:hypothetical protein
MVDSGRLRRKGHTVLVGMAIACLALGGGCKKEKRRGQQPAKPATATSTSTAAPASTIRMGAEGSERQLISGFHEIEDNAWRWTAKSFAVVLAPPAGAVQKGAVLEVRLTVPQVVLTKVSAVSLHASLGGKELAPETFSTPGEHVYRRDVDAALLTGNPVRVDFQLDRAIPPNDVDRRELGIVVSSMGLSAK